MKYKNVYSLRQRKALVFFKGMQSTKGLNYKTITNTKVKIVSLKIAKSFSTLINYLKLTSHMVSTFLISMNKTKRQTLDRHFLITGIMNLVRNLYNLSN